MSNSVRIQKLYDTGGITFHQLKASDRAFIISLIRSRCGIEKSWDILSRLEENTLTVRESILEILD